MLSIISEVSCGPHEKHFLLRFLQHYELTSKPMTSRNTLARILGIPLSRCYQSLSALKAQGVIEAIRERGDLDTRFIVRSLAAVGNDWDERLKEHDHHEQIIELLKTHPIPVEQRQHQLTIPQRILLIALLEEADGFGMVSNMPITKIQQRTGMEPRRIKQHLRSLRKSAYIRAYLSEGSGENDVESFNGIYLLDAQHQSYKLFNEKPREVIFLNCHPKVHREDLNFIFALRRRCIDDRRSFTSKSRANPKPEQSLKKKKPAPSYLAWLNLNWRYLNIVSKILSEHWSSLDAGNNAIVRKELNDWLKDLPLGITCGTPSESENPQTEQEARALSALIAETAEHALGLATSIQKILKPEIILDDAHLGLTLNILPSRLQQRVDIFALEILPSGAAIETRGNGYGAIALQYALEEDAFSITTAANPKLLRAVRARATPEYKCRLRDFQRRTRQTP